MGEDVTGFASLFLENNLDRLPNESEADNNPLCLSNTVLDNSQGFSAIDSHRDAAPLCPVATVGTFPVPNPADKEGDPPPHSATGLPIVQVPPTILNAEVTSLLESGSGVPQPGPLSVSSSHDDLPDDKEATTHSIHAARDPRPHYRGPKFSIASGSLDITKR